MGKGSLSSLFKKKYSIAVIVAMILLSALQFSWLSLFPTGMEDNPGPPSCMRPCKHHKNRIVLDHFGLNGLSDRESIFRVMTDLAGYLCATVYVPPPSTMLSISHNGNQPISQSLMWRDFYKVRFRQNQLNALKQFQAHLADGNLATDPLVLSRVKLFRRHESGEDPWFRVVTRQEEDAVAQIVQLDEFVQRQQSETITTQNSKDHFHWEVYVPHFRWRKDLSALFSNSTRWSSTPSVGLLDDNRDYCSYTEFLSSPLAADIVEKVFAHIQQHHTGIDTYALFHIRRGDSIDTCDTSLSQIHHYLNCSFQHRSLVASHFGHVAILMASDERDACYRSSIANLVERGLGYNFVDLDETVRTVLNESYSRIHNSGRLMNNMYIYHISRLVTKDPRIKLVLEKRRKIHCPDCTNVVEEYAPSRGARFDYVPPSQSNMSDRHLAMTIEQYEICVNETKREAMLY